MAISQLYGINKKNLLSFEALSLSLCNIRAKPALHATPRGSMTENIYIKIGKFSFIIGLLF
jgi:hypothetical protein